MTVCASPPDPKLQRYRTPHSKTRNQVGMVSMDAHDGSTLHDRLSIDSGTAPAGGGGGAGAHAAAQ